VNDDKDKINEEKKRIYQFFIFTFHRLDRRLHITISLSILHKISWYATMNILENLLSWLFNFFYLSFLLPVNQLLVILFSSFLVLFLIIFAYLWHFHRSLSMPLEIGNMCMCTSNINKKSFNYRHFLFLLFDCACFTR
jgi:hypothetical protein